MQAWYLAVGVVQLPVTRTHVWKQRGHNPKHRKKMANTGIVHSFFFHKKQTTQMGRTIVPTSISAKMTIRRPQTSAKASEHVIPKESCRTKLFTGSHYGENPCSRKLQTPTGKSTPKQSQSIGQLTTIRCLLSKAHPFRHVAQKTSMTRQENPSSPYLKDSLADRTECQEDQARHKACTRYTEFYSFQRCLTQTCSKICSWKKATLRRRTEHIRALGRSYRRLTGRMFGDSGASLYTEEKYSLSVPVRKKKLRTTVLKQIGDPNLGWRRPFHRRGDCSHPGARNLLVRDIG